MFRPARIFFIPLIGLGFLGAMGCSEAERAHGQRGAPSSVVGAGGNGQGASGGAEGSGGGSTLGPVVLPTSGPLGPLAVRRLSTPEYQNTVRKLLGADPSITQPFLADDEVLGYRNMAAALRVPLVVAEQYAAAAKQLASMASAQASVLAPCANGTEAVACGEAFIRSFGQSAYRRPLAAAEISAYSSLFSAELGRSAYPAAVGYVVETMLQSPYFLYKTELGEGTGSERELTSFELASQMSYAIVGEPPDSMLMAAAVSNSLKDASSRVGEARRLLARPEATPWLRGFILDWLGISKVASVSKDFNLFPTFPGTLQPSMVEESHRFVDSVLSQHGGSLTTLFTADWSILDTNLATHYGVSVPSGQWSQSSLPSMRLGILLQPGFLAAHSKGNDSYAIGRGKILRTRVLCSEMAPPPATLMVQPIPPSGGTTTREKLAAHRTNEVCNSCHRLIDPLGLGFENFDAIGAYRSTENSKPIDAQGAIVDVSPEVDGLFSTPVEFVQRVAGSQVLRSCVAREILRWSLGRADGTSDVPLLASMSADLSGKNSDLRELLVSLVASASFPYRSDQ